MISAVSKRDQLPMWKKTPEELEDWYRSDPEAFRRAFAAEDFTPPHAATWAARIAADGAAQVQNATDSAASTNSHHFTFALVVSFAIALVFLVPYWVTGDFELDWAVPFLAPFAFVPMLAFHGWRRWGLLGAVAVLTVIVSGIYEAWEFLPERWDVSHALSLHPDWEGAGERINFARQVRDLMMIHWPLLLLGLTGYAYVASRPEEQRVDFVRHVVQVGILTAIIAVAGGALFGLTNLLMITLDIPSAVSEEVNIHLYTWGVSGLLVFGHAVWMRHPNSLERILPTVARIFIPLFVLLECGFLFAYMVQQGYSTLSSDREELLVFNFLLIVVIGLVMLHSAFEEQAGRLTRGLVVALVGLGILADLLGLAAIINRLVEFGATPNRLVVFGSNLVFLGTLAALFVKWVRTKGQNMERTTRQVMNRALAVFVGWTAVVLLVFPLVYRIGLDAEEVEQFEVAAAAAAEEPEDAADESVEFSGEE